MTGPASRYYYHLNLANTLPAIFVTILAGRLSDRIGRKSIMFVPCAVLSVRVGLQMAVAAWRLPLAVFFAGEVLMAVFGGESLFLMAVFASAADTSSLGDRVLRVARMEAALFLGEVVGSLTGGATTAHAGYVATFALSGALMVAAAVLALLVREPLAARNRSPEPLTWHDLNVFRPLIMLARSRGLAFLSVAFFFGVGGFVGFLSSSTLFFRTAYNWTPQFVGYFNAVDFAARGASILIVLPLAQAASRRWFPTLTDRRLAMAGLLAFGVQMATIALWRQTPAALAVATLGLSSGMSVPVIRGLASVLVSPTEQVRLG